MTGKSHALIAANVSLVTLLALGVQDPQVFGLALITGTIAGLLPDLDAPNSLLQHLAVNKARPKLARAILGYRPPKTLIGTIIYATIEATEGFIRALLGLAVELIKRTTTHRGATHSLITWIILTLTLTTLSTITPFSPVISLTFALGYLTHIAADSATYSGVRLLAPLSKQSYHLLPKPLRFKTGSVQEIIVVAITTAISLVFIALSQQPKRLSFDQHGNNTPSSSGFRIQDSGFRIQDSGFRIQEIILSCHYACPPMERQS